MKKYLCILFTVVLLWPIGAAADTEKLRIPPVYQKTPVWCWAAVGEMVFRYYDIPTINPVGNYQCGIVAGLGGQCWVDCRACVVSAPSMSAIASMIEGYPDLVRDVTGQRTRSLTALLDYAALDPEDIIDEIDDGRPVITGISPSGTRYPGSLSEHVALIIGYKARGNRLVLIVNDPFPYRETRSPDPYARAGGRKVRRGQYEVDYRAFVNRLQWKETIYYID